MIETIADFGIADSLHLQELLKANAGNFHSWRFSQMHIYPSQHSGVGMPLRMGKSRGMMKDRGFRL
jgi:hypothetical protein